MIYVLKSTFNGFKLLPRVFNSRGDGGGEAKVGSRCFSGVVGGKNLSEKRLIIT